MLPAPSQRGQEAILKELVVVGCCGVLVSMWWLVSISSMIIRQLVSLLGLG